MNAPKRNTMLLTTPFHSRVEAMCDVNDWGNWMGYTSQYHWRLRFIADE